MRIPFGSFFDRLFQGDHTLGWKMLGGAAVTTFIVVVKVIGADRANGIPFNRTPANLAWLGLNAAALGAGLVLVLSIRDDALRRKESGEPIGFLPSLLASRGCLWTFLGVVALVLTFVIIGLVESAKG
jgi:hypothetical protein